MFAMPKMRHAYQANRINIGFEIYLQQETLKLKSWRKKKDLEQYKQKVVK